MDPHTESEVAPEPPAPSHRRLHVATHSDLGLLARSSVTVVSRGLAKAAQIVFLVIAARLLSVDEFASYSYILALVLVFTVISDTGLPLVSSRDMAAGRGTPRELYWAAFPVVAISAVLAAFALVAFTGFDSAPGTSTGAIGLAALFVVANRFFDFGATTLRGLGRLNLDAALEAGGALVFIAGASALTATGHGVVAVLAVLCAKEWTFAAISYLTLRKEIGAPARPAPDRWRSLLRIGIRLSLASTALALLMRVPLLVLGNSGGAGDVARFSAVQRFGDATVLLATSAGFALLPGVAYLAREDPARAKRLIWRVVGGMAAAATVLAAIAMPFASDLMGLIFGGSFERGGGSLQVLLLGLPAYAVVGVAWYALIAFDREAATLNVALAGLAVAGVMSLVAVPGGGAIAASWAYVAALGTVAVASLWVLGRRLELGRSAAGATSPLPAVDSHPGI